MKNRINFVQTGIQPQIILINLNFVMLLLGISFFVMAGAYVYLTVKLHAVEEDVSTLLSRAAEQKQLIKATTEALQARKQDPKLLAQVEAQQHTLNMKQTVLRELDSRETQKANGFSQLMTDLAQYHQTDLWLTKVALEERYISLQGATTKSTAVPKWIEKLSNAPYFAGREFASASILRDKDKQLNFVLSSELDKIAGGKQ